VEEPKQNIQEIKIKTVNEDLNHMDYFTALRNKKEFTISHNEYTNKLNFELLDYQTIVKKLPKIDLNSFEV